MYIWHNKFASFFIVNKSRYLLPLTVCPVKPVFEIHQRIIDIRGETYKYCTVYMTMLVDLNLSLMTNVIYPLSATCWMLLINSSIISQDEWEFQNQGCRVSESRLVIHLHNAHILVSHYGYLLLLKRKILSHKTKILDTAWSIQTRY